MNNVYELDSEGSKRLIKLMESDTLYKLPDDYDNHLEKDPEKSLQKLHDDGFILPNIVITRGQLTQEEIAESTKRLRSFMSGFVSHDNGIN